jgi:hypothetical protein
MPKFATDGKYLKHQELASDQDTILTIRSHSGKPEVMKGKDGKEDRKWIIYFEEVDKGLALNAVNGKTIAKMYGDEMDDWLGHKIALYVKDDIEMGSELVSGIRVRPKKVA